MTDKKVIQVEGSYAHTLQIPSSWEFAKFSDVIEIIGGSQPPKSEFLEKTEGDCVRLIQIRDYKSDNHVVYIPRDKAKRFVSKDEVMIGRYGPPIFQILRGLEGAYNVALMKAKPRDEIFSNDYLYRYLSNKDIYNYVDSASDRTAGQSGVNKKHLEQYPVAVPPLPEQKRIVEKIDEALAQVDTIKVRLDSIPNLLKRFRQSVLASAVSGKLTEEWRGEVESVDSPYCVDWKWPKVPLSWEVKQYPELVDSRLGKMLDKAKNQGVSTKYLGNINVRWFEFDLKSVQEILVSEKEQQELQLVKGDVLICEGGEPGRCAVWQSNSGEQIIFQKALHRARVKDEVIPEWLAFNLKNDADGLTLNQLFTGTTIKHLTGKALKCYPIRVPPLEEQKEIVRLVEQYFVFADTIEAQVKKAQARVDNLTQSILAKAFRGELVPQDPNDEPADKLLERIAKAREEAEVLAKAAKKAEAAKKRAAKA